MKKVALITLSLIALTSCQTAHPSDDYNHASWVAFCNHHGYSTHTHSRTAISQWLDTWVGSAQEEQATADLRQN